MRRDSRANFADDRRVLLRQAVVATVVRPARKGLICTALVRGPANYRVSLWGAFTGTSGCMSVVGGRARWSLIRTVVGTDGCGSVS